MKYTELMKNKELYVEIGGKTSLFIVEEVSNDGLKFKITNILQENIIKQCLEKNIKDIYFFTLDENNEALKMKCEIKEVNNISLLCTKPEMVNKVQRREFLRIPMKLNVKYFIISEEELKENIVANGLTGENKEEFIKQYKKYFDSGRTVDISEGGLKMETTMTCNKGNIIYIEISKLFSKVAFVGEVLRVEKKGNKFYSGIKILSIDEEDKKNLLNFIGKR